MDRQTIDLLEKTGLNRKVATAVVYLASEEEATSMDLESHTGLRQPEVSTVMKELRHRGWVVKRDVKRPGKGRPLHAYRLARPFEAIVGEIVAEERDKIREIEEVIDALRRRAERIASS